MLQAEAAKAIEANRESTQVTDSSLTTVGTATDLTDLPIGTKLTLNSVSYKVEKKLGKGGFGGVYKAQEEAGGEARHWAVKVAAKSQAVFAVEAIAASQAQALAQEQQRWQGRVFLPTLQAVGDGSLVDESTRGGAQNASLLVMEVASGTLKDHGGFADDALLMVAWGLASTLDLLNTAGFIHGDLKPSNILWREALDPKNEPVFKGLTGWPLLTDFGSAQCFSSMLAEGQPVKNDEQIETYGFTPAFAAPEVRQCGGRMQTMRSDMYSYALTVKKISSGSDMPEVLRELCEQCLQEDPTKRPKSFLAIASALEESCRPCILWGKQLWHEQQLEFLLPALAHRQRHSVQKQGLGVLLAQRKERVGLLMQGRKTKRAIEPLLSCGKHLHSMGSPAEALGHYREALVLNPCCAVHVQLLTNLGFAEGDLGNAARMKALLERALKIWEEFFGEDLPQVAKILTNLGIAEGDLGNAARAKELHERALKIEEGFHGKDNPDLAKALSNLGNAEGDLGNAARKKELHERALKIFEGFYGQDHPEIAKTLTNLGNAEGDLGNAARQKELLERALRIVEDFYGQDHSEVAFTLCNLGNAEGDFGNAARSKELLERALKILEAFYGQDHPGMAKTLANLGTAEGSLGNVARMKELLERVLKIDEGFHGQDHPDVARTLTNLGTAEGFLGNAAGAKELHERALKIFEGFYGQDHPVMAKTLVNWGNAERDLGNAARMKELLERALQILEGFFGENHPEVAKILTNLGVAEGDLGNVARMKELLERALKIEEGFYGQDHPEVAKTLTNLESVEGDLGNTARKKELLERLLKIFEGFHGQDHVKVATILTKLGNAEGDFGNAARMKELLERALKILEGFYGQDHPKVAKILMNLGNAYCQLDMHVAAKVTLERAAEIFDRWLGQSDPHTIKVRQVLSRIRMNEATDRDIMEKSTAWQVEQRVTLRRRTVVEEQAECCTPRELMGKEGTVVDAEGIDDAGRGFIRVFFGPPSSETSGHSRTLGSITADPTAQDEDPRLHLALRVPLTSLEVSGFKCAGKAHGELRLGSFAFAPHVADPRLSRMRCGWRPAKAKWCGKVGTVMEVQEESVKLYFAGGAMLWWDIELFDASLTRCCDFGCSLEHGLVATSGVMCDVCKCIVPVGAATRCCDEHGYDICGYCLGHPTLPPVGAKVIRGPTWRETTSSGAESAASGRDGSEVGIVETELLDKDASQSRGDDQSKVQVLGYHSYFKVRWVKSGNVSYCRGPPFQDVTLAYDIGSAVHLVEASAFVAKLTQAEQKRILGNKALQAKNFEEAEHLYGEAIAVGGDATPAIYFSSRASARSALGDWTGASDDAKRATQLPGGIVTETLFQKVLAEIMLEDMASIDQTMAVAAEHDLSNTVEEMVYNWFT